MVTSSHSLTCFFVFISGFIDDFVVKQDNPLSGDYDFNHAYRGLAIVISQENFTKESGNGPRPYAQKEIQNMREIFSNLGFHVVCFTDLSCQQMIDVLAKGAFKLRLI